MTQEITRAPGTPEAFTLCLNRLADPTGTWRAEQDAILNDRAFETAQNTITDWPGYAETPLVSLPALAESLGIKALKIKDESSRFGLGSFKALGGAYAVARLLQSELSRRLGQPVSMADVTARAYPDEAAKITVCCATDGNHGRSVAWGAQTFGARCVIFIHATVSEGRKQAIEAYDAEVRRCPGNYDDSVRTADETAAREGWFVVSDTSYPGYMDVPRDVMQGYELMAAEAFDALPAPPTHILLQTGVGGMAAAVAAQAVRRWGAQRPRIILCDPDQSVCWLASIRAGHPEAVTGDLDTLMAGLACGEVSALAWEILRDHADAVIALTDASAIAAMRCLANPLPGDPPLVAGESAVAGLAALTLISADEEARDMLALEPSSIVLLFSTEGDTDPALYEKLIGKSAASLRSP
ncbi:diaminopropionate ammonia-lyase [Rhodalgimonas zhirmunskyi]|uniref:Diaminopropionate ammonia-lyase n=1 Tax=Rhodalgimonas zhirmunskyi TaxID=2964767 RepID=A0AAJ1U9Y5_9RHOB|nr:diaminopropionate ammonia-lyase [Rhodoalgimonas zhirmunskyi]MDQ2093948.1 diaminopropionate ammonia-lyase [Rhodoalgimonas zhirmunskyi]